MREIVLDTETTGLRVSDNHKLIEIGCVEMVNRVMTGRYYQVYLNPKRSIDPGAFQVHGISEEFLRDKPTFSQIAKDFLQFIGNSPLIIHNASYDLSFLNYEMAIMGLPEISRNRVVDTLLIARKKYPGSPASLDALCRKFGISNEHREKHGALLDSELLAQVYISMQGITQNQIVLNSVSNIEVTKTKAEKNDLQTAFSYRKFYLSIDAKDQHQALMKKIVDPIWYKTKSLNYLTN